jgi:hypothetical protein
MPVRTQLIVALGCLALAMPAAAQDTLSSVHVVASDADSASWDAGRREGRESANDAIVAHRGLIGFLVGVPIGFWLLPAVYSANPALLVAEGTGAAAMVAVGKVGNANPPEKLMAAAATHGPDYARGVQEGYTDRLRSRRATAVAGGAVVGLMTGAGMLLLLLLHSD